MFAGRAREGDGTARVGDGRTRWSSVEGAGPAQRRWARLRKVIEPNKKTTAEMVKWESAWTNPHLREGEYTREEYQHPHRG